MLNRNRFQHNISTGRFLFPVVAFVALLFWAVAYRHPSEFLALAACVATTYVLIELDITFALIRTRTALPSSLFLFFYAACPFLHGYTQEIWIPLLVGVMLFSLFRSYESPVAPTPIFHAFLCIGIGSFLLPHLLLFIPILYLMMIPLRSLSMRTFFAGLTGIATPYWLMGCYYLYLGAFERTFAPFREVIHFSPIDYHALSVPQCVSSLIFILITAFCCVQCLFQSYNDKVQTRILLRLLIVTEVTTTLLVALQPVHFNALFPVLLFIGSLMAGHYFSLTYTRFTRIFFGISFILWLGTGLFNVVWMLLFNS